MSERVDVGRARKARDRREVRVLGVAWSRRQLRGRSATATATVLVVEKDLSRIQEERVDVADAEVLIRAAHDRFERRGRHRVGRVEGGRQGVAADPEDIMRRPFDLEIIGGVRAGLVEVHRHTVTEIARRLSRTEHVAILVHHRQLCRQQADAGTLQLKRDGAVVVARGPEAIDVNVLVGADVAESDQRSGSRVPSRELDLRGA